jgi:hypothetical protein
MARPTKNRRSTKHRGNAAGMIEARGRTGRKPSASEKGTAATKGSSRRSGSSGGRKNRYDSPPTWKGAALRAVVAAAIVYVVSTLLLKHTSATTNVALVPVVLALYTPMIYYTDLYMYRRAQRKKSSS